MSNRGWQWFKHGYQFEIEAKGKLPNVDNPRAKVTVFCETKDKQDARRAAIDELHKCGYTNIEVLKVIAR